MSILKRLEDKNVVYFELSKDKTTVNVMEGCDLYYSVDLTKSELKQLISELQELESEMPDELRWL